MRGRVTEGSLQYSVSSSLNSRRHTRMMHLVVLCIENLLVRWMQDFVWDNQEQTSHMTIPTSSEWQMAAKLYFTSSSLSLNPQLPKPNQLLAVLWHFSSHPIQDTDVSETELQTQRTETTVLFPSGNGGMWKRRQRKKEKGLLLWFLSSPMQLSLVNSLPKRNPWGFHIRLLRVVLTWSNLASEYTLECFQASWHAVVVDNNMSEKKPRYRKGESALLAGFRHYWICFIDPATQSSELLSDSSRNATTQGQHHRNGKHRSLKIISPFWKSFNSKLHPPICYKLILKTKSHFSLAAPASLPLLIPAQQ